MNGFEVDHGVLDDIARTLYDASAAVDRLGHSIPPTPDGGDGTPALVGILAHLVQNAATLVLGAAAAGDDVTSANLAYQELDDTARADLQRATEER